MSDVRVPKGAGPTGGQWAAQVRAEGGALTEPLAKHTVGLSGVATFDTMQDEPLAHPEGLPEVDIDFDHDNDAGLLTVTFFIEDKAYSFTNDPFDGWQHNVGGDKFEEAFTFEDADEDEFIEWAKAVGDNIDINVSAVASAALDTKVRAALIEASKGGPVTHDDETPYSARATANVDRAFNTGWVSTDNEPETQLGDALADLMHWAKVNGVDFHEELQNAEAYFEEEASTTPAG